VLALAVTNLNDAIRVLTERGLHADAVFHLEHARVLTQQAQAAADPAARSSLLDQAIREEDVARGLMIVGPAWK
jgi:hypothetical protein